MSNRAKYGWMTLGGLLCLFGLVLACKVRDGNRAMAQTDTPPLTIPAPIEAPEAKPSDDKEPRVLPPIRVSGPIQPPKVEEVRTTGGEAPAMKPAAPPASEPRSIVIPTVATMPAAPPGETSPPSAPTGVSAPLPPITPPSPPATSVPPPAPSAPPALPSVSANVSSVPSTPSVPPTTVKVPEIKPDAPRDVPGEPPLAPTPGPVIQYKVERGGETFRSLARKTLGSSERWTDIHKLNPTHKPDATFPAGTLVRLPGDACLQEDESLRPLPTLRQRTPPRPRAVLPLTGTFSVTLDEKKVLSLPRAIVEQLGNCDTVLVSPGSDKCLWLTNQAHLDRLQAKLDKSPARESDVRGFKRLYYAQTMKVPMKDGRVELSERLAHFAGLGQEIVLVGIDDHFEVWDAARWRRYTQNKKAGTAEE